MKWQVRGKLNSKRFDVLMSKYPTKVDILKTVRNLGLVSNYDSLEVYYGKDTITVHHFGSEVVLCELERVASGPYDRFT